MTPPRGTSVLRLVGALFFLLGGALAVTGAVKVFQAFQVLQAFQVFSVDAPSRPARDQDLGALPRRAFAT